MEEKTSKGTGRCCRAGSAQGDWTQREVATRFDVQKRTKKRGGEGKREGG